VDVGDRFDWWIAERTLAIAVHVEANNVDGLRERVERHVA
jgi:hypothetical protein